MEQTKYEVVFMGDYPGGDRHPVKVVTTATNATIAIGIASDALEDDRIQSTNHELISATPIKASQSADGDNIHGLLPCPFCGSPDPKIMDAYVDGEQQYFVNCGCCNTTQHPDSRDRAIHDWNQRNAVEVNNAQH